MWHLDEGGHMTPKHVTIQWTEQEVNDISLLPFVLLQAVYCYYRVPMSQAFLFQKAGNQDSHTLFVCGIVPC